MLLEASWGSLWLAGVGFVFCQAIYYVVYNLYFHPLAKYPGPFLARISGIPDFCWALTGRRHLWLCRNHETYGEVFRYRPDAILFKSPPAYRAIYSPKANVKRSHFYQALRLNSWDNNTLSVDDPAAHSQKRMALQSVLSDKFLRSVEPIVLKHITRWCHLLTENEGRGWTSPKKMSEACDVLIFDILCDLLFGISTDVKEPGQNMYCRIPQATKTLLLVANWVGRVPFLDSLLWLKPRGLDWVVERLWNRDVRSFLDFVEDSVSKQLSAATARSESEDQQRSILSHLISALDSDQKDSHACARELTAEARMLIIAGLDTTLVSMTAIFFYLTQSQEANQRLASEIRSTFETLEEIREGPKLLSCKYLRACVSEAMRLAPGGPSELPRVVLPGGLAVNGRHIPEGSIVGLSNWALTRNEAVFPEAHAFRPERWLIDEKTKEAVSRGQGASFPFSAGPGSCVGKHLALLELQLTVAITIWLMDMRVEQMERQDSRNGSPRTKSNVTATIKIRDSYISIVSENALVQFKKRIE